MQYMFSGCRDEELSDYSKHNIYLPGQYADEYYVLKWVVKKLYTNALH